MENIWIFLQQTAAGGLCALFLLLLQRIFRNLLSPRWQYGIWGVLVLRLMIPVGARGRSTVLDVWPWLEAARAGAELALDSAYSSPWTLSLPRGPLPILPAEPPRSLTDWLFLLYLAGALGLALWYLGCALRLSLRVSRGVPVEGPRRAAIDAVAQRYQLPRPRRVVECRWERSPFLTGFFAPALVLPMGWEPDEAVILHKLLHLKHRDLWAGWLTAALRCLHWCDPLLWLAFDKADNDREALCDQRVLERLEGEDRRDYGRVLLSMADSRAVRVPGATTMANGARAIQARIQAIARFKRFPRGMALVSGCMGAALVMALAVGGPAPGGETDPVTVSPQGCSVPGILATAERSRAATVAGALDSYGKAMLHRLHQPALALLCRGMTVPEEDLPQVLEQYREALRLSEEHPEQLLRWWRSGPVFRGLVSDGGGGFLCQVFWFRDQEMQVGDVYPREDGAPWPVEYLCHTVHLLPDGPYWTVEKLAETEGLLEDDFYDMDLPLCGPVTWSGEADGLRLEISAAQILETGDGFLGRERLRTLHDPSSFPFTIGETEEDDALSPAPMPRLPGFSALYSGMVVTRENTCGQQRSYMVDIVPYWNDPDIVDIHTTYDHANAQALPETTVENRASFHQRYEFHTLEAGEQITFHEGGGGGSGWRDCWTGDLRQYTAPDGFTACVINARGETFSVPLTPQYTTPDGGSFSLAPEREEVLP